MPKTDDFLPTFDDDINEFDFGQIPPEPKPDNECSFACEVRRLKRELKDKNTAIKKLREENNKIHARCSKLSDQLNRYRKGVPTPTPTQNTIPTQNPYMPQPRISYTPMVGYPQTTPIVYNDLPYSGMRFQ